MSAQDRAIQKLAKELAGIKREVVSWRGPQADYTSIENGGNFTFKDSDGNVTAVVGGQDDGSNTIRHVDGPTPPIPSGLSAHVDGPIVQVSWDGTFEDADTATHDWSHLEVIVAGPSNEQLTATINDITGASTSVAATASGEWDVFARSVSRAEKRSLDGDAGTVDVKLVDIDGAIEAVQDSANGKNKVTYSEFAPTPADPGIFDDTWFVGQVGRPNDVVEATNFAKNPTFTSLLRPMGAGENMSSGGGAALSVDSSWSAFGDTSLKIVPGSSASSAAYVRSSQTDSPDGDWAGKTITISATIRLTEPMTGSTDATGERSIVVGYRTASGGTVWTHARSNVAPNSAGVTRCVVTTTLPSSDMSNWFIRLFNGSTTVPVWWDGLSVVEASAASTYFDGDTPSGATDNESHYRWTGTPHASTSEKYLPALTIGDSDNWNIIEQYRHDGTGWVKVELSHHVFSTVDLGKATVGELDGIRIKGQTIHGEQLSGDAIDGKVITGANIRTAPSGARVQMDVGGLRVFDASNDQVVQLPSDGTAATFNGELVAKSLTSTGRASFLAENNRLEPGAGLVLAAGVGDPPSPPVVSNHYKQITPPPLADGEYALGLAWADGSWWRAINAVGAAEGDRIERINADGDIEASFPTGEGDPRGLTAIGNELFLLAQKRGQGSNRWVFVYDLNGNLLREWEYPSYGTGTYQPGIGRDEEGRVVIAQCWSDGKLSWRTFSPTGTFINITTRDAPVKSDAVGIYGGTADFGATRTVFAKGFTPGTNRQFTVYGTNGNDYFPEQSWCSPDRGDVKGLAWDGEKFYSIDPAGVITEYGSLNMGDDSANWWATYRWVGSGGKTTRIAPPARFVWARRSRLRVSAPNLPQGVTTIEPSLAFKTTTPARSEFTSPAWVAGATPATVNYEVLDPYWYVGSPPGDVNNFPNSTPSSVKAASGLFEVKGDGSGKWGPLTFNPDGSMSSSAVPAWVPITAFASGFSVQSWGFAPAYRVWPDGKVEWRGVVAGSFNGTVHPFTVPAAARPIHPVNLPAAVTAVGSEYVTRVEFAQVDNPTLFRVYRGSADRTWVSLDGLTYYKS